MLGDTGASSFLVGFGKGYSAHVQNMDASCQGTPAKPYVRPWTLHQPRVCAHGHLSNPSGTRWLCNPLFDAVPRDSAVLAPYAQKLCCRNVQSLHPVPCRTMSNRHC